MKPVIIIAIAVVIGIGMALMLFTNIDEMISETVSEVVIDQSTFYFVTNDYPVNTDCEYAVLVGEFQRVFYNHTDWFYSEFGDMEFEFKKKVQSKQGVRWDSQEMQILYEEYAQELRTRVNPDILERWHLYSSFTVHEVIPGFVRSEQEVECNKNYSILTGEVFD